MGARIRVAGVADAAAIQRIYAPYVAGTAISFELKPPDVAEIGRRIRTTLERHPWLVAETDERGVIGYAYGSRHRERAAYQWAADVSVYVDGDAHGRGVGRALYAALIPLLRAQGFVNAYGGITEPNAASIGLHEALGFKYLGTYTGAGFKLGAWHDVGWWALQLADLAPDPVPPVPFPDLPMEVIEAALVAATETLVTRPL